MPKPQRFAEACRGNEWRAPDAQWERCIEPADRQERRVIEVLHKLLANGLVVIADVEVATARWANETGEVRRLGRGTGNTTVAVHADFSLRARCACHKYLVALPRGDAAA